jgi:hypothetical protein
MFNRKSLMRMRLQIGVNKYYGERLILVGLREKPTIWMTLYNAGMTNKGRGRSKSIVLDDSAF